MDDKDFRILRRTLERFESGGWCRGSAVMFGFNGMCLVASINYEAYGKATDAPTITADRIARLMGFSGTRYAIRFNDNTSRKAVIKRIKETLRQHSTYDQRNYRLHDALADSRAAHARRGLGKKVPDLIPAAWVEEVMAPRWHASPQEAVSS